MPDLFLRIQYVEDRLKSGETDVALMRELQRLKAELAQLDAEGKLSYKTSRRYRSVMRAPKRRSSPPLGDN